MPLHQLLFVARRREQRPVATLKTCFHSALHSALVVIALILGSCGKQCLHKLPFGRLVKRVNRAFDCRAKGCDLLPDVEVSHYVTGNALDVVHNHHEVALVPIGLKKVEQGIHAFTINVST
ncbi:MAG: hypothetical protein PHZ00_04935 [Candidatus Peribacteraceae bacterium]|nr:hypothetical protein [Candidatus Peribacteraceae bacterium]